MNRKKGRKPSLLQSFTLVSLVLLMVGLSVTGWWVSRQIAEGVISRVGHATSLFAGSVISPYILDLLADPNNQEDLRELMSESSLGEEIVAFKVWDREGLVLFSTNEVEIGQKHEIEAGLRRAWYGSVSAELSDLGREEHEQQRKTASRLLETYTPIREPGTGRIVAVVEFYQSVDEMIRELRTSRIKSWGIVSLVVLTIYLSLVFIVRRGSGTILRQRDELEQRVSEYRTLLTANSELNKRVSAAAVKTTALNEQFLRRIAAELHDGPAQDIGYSLLMIDEIGGSDSCKTKDDTKVALGRALSGIRDISAGLRSPDLDSLSLADVVDRAVRIHGSRSKGQADVSIDGTVEEIGLAAKITVYRVIQEALSNAFKHAGDQSPKVEVTCHDDLLSVSVADHGKGIETKAGDHLGMGLSIMQERVELLGGRFSVTSDHTSGTTISAEFPVK